MSFDLAFWRSSGDESTEQAARIYHQLIDGVHGAVDPSPLVAAFYRAATMTYPELSEDNAEESPWAAAIDVTDEGIITPISPSRSREVTEVLLDLAARHGLTAYDPQTRAVHPASRGPHP